MTTIGYGDISPSTFIGKILAILYLPLAVIALADAVSDVQLIGLRRSIRETDFGKQMDECLLRDSVRDGYPPNMEPVLSEAEFLIDQMTANELVDSAAVVAIRRQFMHITRRGKFESEEDRKLTSELVFEELKQRAAAGKALSPGAQEYDLDENGKFKWRTYEEWKQGSWALRVLEAGKAALDDPSSNKVNTVSKPQGAMKTVAGAMRGSHKR